MYEPTMDQAEKLVKQNYTDAAVNVMDLAKSQGDMAMAQLLDPLGPEERVKILRTLIAEVCKPYRNVTKSCLEAFREDARSRLPTLTRYCQLLFVAISNSVTEGRGNDNDVWISQASHAISICSEDLHRVDPNWTLLNSTTRLTLVLEQMPVRVMLWKVIERTWRLTNNKDVSRQCFKCLLEQARLEPEYDKLITVMLRQDTRCETLDIISSALEDAVRAAYLERPPQGRDLLEHLKVRWVRWITNDDFPILIEINEILMGKNKDRQKGLSKFLVETRS